MELSAVSGIHSSLALREKAALDGAEKTQAGQGLSSPEAPARVRFDRYEESGGGSAPPGVYAVEADGAEGYRIAFRPPEDGGTPPDRTPEQPEKTTVNTDRVDGELRQLKKEQSDLERQISQAERAGADLPQLPALRQRLSAVEAELAQKDTDAYRRTRASVATE